ncbi:DUF6377 domain-containing protein [Flammeovirga kamogawensis]|uniref:DUF6377 domain-containing protein n=1 Tax=Flammeovirga kamogawensis TaxID=373891 RepID=A0ABX8H370_9BACT|nr:DUF6377 domain-containing protein [Flammeovirga kamogawensis]MBB6463260.1 cell division protein FtsL [Flammeovirga kamogawensis]QWG09590.1 hypothetical protein KM029_23565 [Flammeovirga kamogawensis]TRX65104.1 hypothetical protein EO216_21465 [Flammeovirga kamogawensis]
MKLSIRLCIFLIVGIINFSIAQNETDSLFKVLDDAIEKREIYLKEKNNSINEFRVLLENDTTDLKDKYFYATEIYEQYLVFEFYGALHFAYVAIDVAKQLNEQKLINESRLNLARILVIAGIYQESSEILDALDIRNLSNDLLVKYFLIRKELYNQLYYYSPTKIIKQGYQNKYINYCDSLLEVLPENSESNLEILETRALDNRKLDKAKKLNALRLSRYSIGQHNYSKIAFQRSLIYEVAKDDSNQKKYLILSAISDIKGVIKDNASLSTLAFKLYHEGDVERAYKYINICYEDALFYNSKLRAIQIANILPVISQSYEAQLISQKSRLESFNIIITIMSIILFVAIIFIYKQVKSVRSVRNTTVEINNKLRESNAEQKKANEQLTKLHTDLTNTNLIKEIYIGEFLKICSDYIEKLEYQSTHTKRMLVARKYGELLKELKDDDVRKKEMKLFYKNFDQTFLHIYPTFVDDFNKLLEPDQPVLIKNKDLLNTELRIFALVRLGINDSAKISKLLGNSVTTIYNYRVKIKNKSIVDRENFDDYVMRIGDV